MSSEQFGSWVALAVHDTSSVIGAAMSFNDNAVETTTLKLEEHLVNTLNNNLRCFL